MPAHASATETRSLLLARLADLVGRDERLSARLRHDGGMPDDWPERAPTLASEEVVSRLDEEARAEILAIRSALARIDAGTWGTCAACGDEIAAGRLKAIPWTDSCTICAEAAE